MGVKELREVFNAVSQPAFSCEVATLHYARNAGGEWQILTFRGTGNDGTTFEVNSGHLKGGVNVEDEAKKVAQALIAQRKPAP